MNSGEASMSDFAERMDALAEMVGDHDLVGSVEVNQVLTGPTLTGSTLN